MNERQTNEKPILFSGEMVRAILDGRKTMTRRVIKPQPDEIEVYSDRGIEKCRYIKKVGGKDGPEWAADIVPAGMPTCIDLSTTKIKCPYGRPGDLLWVRESFSYITKAKKEAYHKIRPDGCPVEMLYRATAVQEGWEDQVTWSASIHMPKWASRIKLQVTAVRVERLQDISAHDAMWEGIGQAHSPLNKATIETLGSESSTGQAAIEEFRKLWNIINGRRGYYWSDDDLPDNMKTGNGLVTYSNPWVWVVEFEMVQP